MAVSPKIDWSGAPAGTVTFALIMHDTDVDINGDDVLHWAIFNVREPPPVWRKSCPMLLIFRMEAAS
jgi:phosphatidylethanolamine-binding protein (PEBP) family uncharacterized protein